MATITNYNGQNPDPTRRAFPVGPIGTFIAVICEVLEVFGFLRPKYEDKSQNETIDGTRFTFAFKDQTGQLHFQQTTLMRLSASEKSSFYKLIEGMYGSVPWASDAAWDQRSCLGKVIQISIAHQQSKGGRIYSRLTSVSPCMPQFTGYAPTMPEALAGLRSYQERAEGQLPQRVAAPPASMPMVWQAGALPPGAQGAVQPLPPGFATTPATAPWGGPPPQTPTTAMVAAPVALPAGAPPVMPTLPTVPPQPTTGTFQAMPVNPAPWGNPQGVATTPTAATVTLPPVASPATMPMPQAPAAPQQPSAGANARAANPGPFVPGDQDADVGF